VAGVRLHRVQPHAELRHGFLLGEEPRLAFGVLDRLIEGGFVIEGVDLQVDICQPAG